MNFVLKANKITYFFLELSFSEIWITDEHINRKMMMACE